MRPSITRIVFVLVLFGMGFVAVGTPVGWAQTEDLVSLDLQAILDSINSAEPDDEAIAAALGRLKTAAEDIAAAVTPPATPTQAQLDLALSTSQIAVQAARAVTDYARQIGSIELAGEAVALIDSVVPTLTTLSQLVAVSPGDATGITALGQEQLGSLLGITQSVTQTLAAAANLGQQTGSTSLATRTISTASASLPLLGGLFANVEQTGNADMAGEIAQSYANLGNLATAAAVQARSEQDTGMSNLISNFADGLIPQAESVAVYSARNGRPESAIPAISALNSVIETYVHLEQATAGLRPRGLRVIPSTYANRIKAISGSLQAIGTAMGANAPSQATAALAAANERIQTQTNAITSNPQGGGDLQILDDTAPASPI
jgi:hypothetical protein